MNSQTTNRLVQEYKQLRKQGPDPDIDLVPEEDDIRRWTAFLRGPPQTPYDGFRYHLDITVPDTYPLTPPSIRSVTKVFHPNFHFKTGEICLDIFKSEWTPAWTLQNCCRAIMTLLSHPEADSPFNCDAGNLLRSGDVKGFQSLARMYASIYAQPI